MPHKRNPLGSAVVLAAAVRVPGLVGSMLAAMVQEQQRGLGGWQAEWELLPETVSLFAGALHHLTEVVAGLQVDAAAMRRNLEANQGLAFAEAVEITLRSRLGGGEARQRVEAACDRARDEGRHLREVLADDAALSAHLKPEELAQLFDPGRYVGAAQDFIDRVLFAHSAQPATPPGEGG